VLTSLSPCVLPILPLVLGAAASERKYGPVALAAGLAISFVLVGLFVATIGYSIGLTTELFRQVAAALMVMLGAVLIFPPLQTRLALASGPIANWTDRHFGSERGSGYASQFWVGVLLGAIWTPCVGPTLGAASLLAAQGRDLPQVAASMSHSYRCSQATSWRGRGNEPRHTVPPKIKRKLCRLAVAHVAELHHDAFLRQRAQAARMALRRQGWTDTQIAQILRRSPPEPIDLEAPDLDKVLEIVNRRAPASTLRRKAASRKLRGKIQS
jgi:Cytochrome C biogenesis protein transmembrane region